MTECEKIIEEVLVLDADWEKLPSNYSEAYLEVYRLALAAPKLARILKVAMRQRDSWRQVFYADWPLKNEIDQCNRVSLAKDDAELDQIARGAEGAEK